MAQVFNRRGDVALQLGRCRWGCRHAALCRSPQLPLEVAELLEHVVG